MRSLLLDHPRSKSLIRSKFNLKGGGVSACNKCVFNYLDQDRLMAIQVNSQFRPENRKFVVGLAKTARKFAACFWQKMI